MYDKVDLIAFGAHPDDVEIGCGGLLLKSVAQGYRVGIVDLTRGEMSSTGTVEERQQEAAEAAAILGVSWRVNLGLPDRGIVVDGSSLEKFVRLIRQTKPKLILAPFWEDRHPDHIACSRLVTEGQFSSRLYKFVPEIEPHQPRLIYYFLNHYQVQASFVVDITNHFSKKIQAVGAHHSQFDIDRQTKTSLNSGSFFEVLEGRNCYWGSLIRVNYGEGYYSKEMLAIANPLELL